MTRKQYVPRSKKQTVATNRNWSKRIIAGMYSLPSTIRTLTPVECMQLRQATDILDTMLMNWDDNTKALLAATHNIPATDNSPLDKQQ